MDRPRTLEEIRRAAVLAALARNRGNKKRTADELGVTFKSIYNWLNKWADDGHVTRDWLNSLNTTTTTEATT